MNELMGSTAIFCPILFALFYLQIERVYCTILQKIAFAALNQSDSMIANIANHWIITLDILYLFTKMIPIRYHRLQTTI